MARTPRYPDATWDVRQATPEQLRAARFLAQRLRSRFNPKHHESVWDMDPRHLQAAWYELARRDFGLYVQVHKTSSEVQAVVTAILQGRIPLNGRGES